MDRPATQAAPPIYVGSQLPFDVLGGAALGWAAGALVLLVFGAPSGQPSVERVRRALHVYGCDPADLQPLPGQDRRSARYMVSSRSGPACSSRSSRESVATAPGAGCGIVAGRRAGSPTRSRRQHEASMGALLHSR